MFSVSGPFSHGAYSVNNKDYSVKVLIDAEKDGKRYAEAIKSLLDGMEPAVAPGQAAVSAKA